MNLEPSPVEWRLRKSMARCVNDFNLIEEGDRIMVAISGGKDSYGLLVLLDSMLKRVPINFEIIAVHLDQVQPGYDGKPMVEWLEREAYPYKILRQDTYSVVKEKVAPGKTYCSLCSRLRRGILYNAAVELGCTKIALGHHRDDLLETFLLNFMFSGQLKTMPPKLLSDDGRNVIIRPLAYAKEADLVEFSEERGFPILPCNLCGTQENLRRKSMKQMLTDLEARWPECTNYMFKAMTNVRPSHIPDIGLWKDLNLPIAQTLTPRSGDQGSKRGGFPSDIPLPRVSEPSPRDSLDLKPPGPISEERIQEELGF